MFFSNRSFKWVRASARNLGAGLCLPSAFGRAAASPQTRQMRCWPSSERTTNPSSRRKRQDSLSLSLVLFPPKPLRWVSAGALLGEMIRLPFCIFGISVWGWYHYPRRALHAVETLDARGSRRRIRRFYAAAVLAMCGQNIPSVGHTPPQPRTAHTAAHRAKHGVVSPPETPTGSIGSTARVPCASSLSARRSSMSRLPLLRRTTAEMPISLSVSTLCRIRRDTFLCVMPSVPTGSILSVNSVGVPINSS